LKQLLLLYLLTGRSSGSSSNGSGRNLWVSGLSSSTKATDLKNAFTKYGKVSDLMCISFLEFIHPLILPFVLTMDHYFSVRLQFNYFSFRLSLYFTAFIYFFASPLFFPSWLSMVVACLF